MKITKPLLKIWEACPNGYDEKYAAALAVADSLLQPAQASQAEQAQELFLRMVNAKLAEAAELNRV